MSSADRPLPVRTEYPLPSASSLKHQTPETLRSGPPMSQSESLLNLKVPWGQQTIELHETHFEGTSVKLLRVRIREGKRFTIFDIDAVTAREWGETMSRWADRQQAQSETPDEVLKNDVIAGER
jgi:hypothetical protein